MKNDFEQNKKICGVVRDLRSVSSDGLASQASARLIKEHLRTCPDCREFYREKRIIASGGECACGDYVKLAKRLRRRQIVCALGAAALVTGAALCVFFGGREK